MALALKASTVFAMARGALLDDHEAQEWPDDALVAPLNLAQLALEAKVFSNPNIDRMKTWVIVPNVPAGTTDLSAYFGPGKVLELLNELTNMRERQAGTSDSDFMPMTMTRDLPPAVQTTYNNVYFWDGQTIKIPGATQALDFRIFGEFAMKPIVNGDSALMPNTGLILAYLMAGIAANARAGGKKVGDPLEAKGNFYASMWMNVMIMEMQDEPLQQQPFRSVGNGWF